MIALYRYGTSPLHRLPAGPKLLGFAVIAIAISLLVTAPLPLGIAGLGVVAAYLLAGLGPREFWRQLWATRWLLLVMAATQLVFLPPITMLVNCGRVVVVLLLAGVLTLTTRVPDLLDLTERMLSPFRRFGVRPRSVGLVLALTIAAIPVIGRFARDVADAQRARGLTVRPHRAVMPLLVLTLKHGDELGEALAARGVE